MAAFGAGLSGLTTALVVLARSCLENPALLLALCPLVLTAAVFAPFVLPLARQETVPRFVFPLLTLLVLLSPMLLGLAGRPLALVYPVLAALGIVRAARPLASAGWRAAALLAIGTAVLAPYFLSEILRHPYAHIFVPEYALLGPGLLALDTLLHASVAHMIQAFGVASTGLDGLVPFRYHVASHAWFAGIGRLAGSTPLVVYPLAQAALAVPALMTALLLATVCLSRDDSRLAVRAAVALGLVLVSDAVGWTSYYIGESHTLGLVVALLAFPLLADLVETPVRAGGWDRLRLAAAAGLVFVATAAKVSTGVVLGAGFAWAVLRGPAAPWRKTVGLALLGATGLVALALFQAKTGHALDQTLELLSFYRRIGLAAWPAQLTLVLPLLYLGTALVRRRLDRRREVLLVMTIVALVPGLTLRLWGATVWWFWNVPHWAVLPLIASDVALEGRLGTVMARALPLAVGALALVRIDLAPAVQLASTLAWPAVAPSTAAFAREWVTDCGGQLAGPIPDRLREGEGARLLAAVHALAPVNHSAVGIFIPPSNRTFWNLEERWACRRRPLYVPALTGLPLVQGLGPGCPNWGHGLGYGFGDYSASSVTTALDDEALCAHARRRGVTTVLVIESTTETGRNRVLACPG
jgi:hypothetical protein